MKGRMVPDLFDLPFALLKQYYQDKGRALPCSRKVFVAGTGSNWTEGRRNSIVLSSWGFITG